jgi:hypothetical protein
MCDNCRLIRRKRKILVICTKAQTTSGLILINKGNKKLWQNKFEQLKKNEDSETTKGVVVQSTFNNTIVTITNLKGEVISWSSAGLRV